MSYDAVRIIRALRAPAPAGASKPSTVLPDTLFGLLLPSGRFSHETRLARTI